MPARDAFIPAWLDELDLTPQQFRVYAHVSRRGNCYSCLPTIAKSCRLSLKTVKKVIKELVNQGMILKTSRPGRSSIYRVNSDFKHGAQEDLGFNPIQAEVDPIPGPQCDSSPGDRNGLGLDQKGTTKVNNHKDVKLRLSHSKSKGREIPNVDDLICDLDFPGHLSGGEMRDAFIRWIEHRVTKKSPGDTWKELFQYQIEMIQDMSYDEAVAAVKHSRVNGFSSIFACPNLRGSRYQTVNQPDPIDPSDF